jgi:hypothetical protein
MTCSAAQHAKAKQCCSMVKSAAAATGFVKALRSSPGSQIGFKWHAAVCACKLLPASIAAVLKLHFTHMVSMGSVCYT